VRGEGGVKSLTAFGGGVLDSPLNTKRCARAPGATSPV
jgi:hypothetical protein